MKRLVGTTVGGPLSQPSALTVLFCPDRSGSTPAKGGRSASGIPLTGNLRIKARVTEH